jgi:hypothetical protein
MMSAFALWLAQHDAGLDLDRCADLELHRAFFFFALRRILDLPPLISLPSAPTEIVTGSPARACTSGFVDGPEDQILLSAIAAIVVPSLVLADDAAAFFDQRRAPSPLTSRHGLPTAGGAPLSLLDELQVVLGRRQDLLLEARRSSRWLSSVSAARFCSTSFGSFGSRAALAG